MILLGAGASAPLGIPTMEGFVRIFEEKIREDGEIKSLYDDVKSSIKNSVEFIGMTVTFDLESLTAILEDISGVREKRTISSPTLAFVLYQFKKGWKGQVSNVQGIHLEETLEKCLRNFDTQSLIHV